MSRLPPRPRSAGRPARPAGFTLVELLVAATLALVVMAALASLFGIFGRAVADSQDLVQLGARMRSAAWRLRQDLQGVTTEVKAFIRPESACGYFEIIEGPMVETSTAMVADVDDILMLTTASPGRPFTGLLSGTVSFESPVAEVAWFCKQGPPTADGLQLYNLYRRQLLVSAAPGAGAMQSTNSVASSTWDAFYLTNDLSVRLEGGTLIANSLADLVRRQSRFMHNPLGTVNPSVLATWPQITTGSASTTGEILAGVREGEDLMLANVTAFDVRVFDPQQATVTITGTTFGAYADLGGGGSASLGGSGAAAFTGMPAGAKVYDTWSLHTEFNNVTDGSVQDQGTNLADNNGNGVVDDAGELEASPPYNVPLRGVEIRIRCYDPSSQEVRQITVQHSFIAR
ncbi:MAG: type II secretion system protein J [Planctomycetaceae bacterium]